MMQSIVLASISCFCFLLISFPSTTIAEIANLNELYDAIEAGPNRKVGFLSLGNYQAVKNTLPASVQPTVVGTVDLLNTLINNGTLIAGLLTQIPPDGFNQFSSGVISPQAMFFAPNASSLLTKAVNAAIIRVIQAGGSYQAARNNQPFSVIEANSCFPSSDYYPFPTPSEVVGEPWFQRGFIRVASLGGVNWGNTGNYQSTPPTGFWPEYFDAISAELVAYYGNSFKGLQRTYYTGSNSVIESVLSNQADVTEGYFVVNGLYKNKPRTSVLAPSCFVLASGSTYYTKRDDSSSESDPGLSDGAIAGITIGAVVLVVGSFFLAYIVYKERQGKPLFMPLRDHDDEEAAYRQRNGSNGNNDTVAERNNVETAL